MGLRSNPISGPPSISNVSHVSQNRDVKPIDGMNSNSICASFDVVNYIGFDKKGRQSDHLDVGMNRVGHDSISSSDTDSVFRFRNYNNNGSLTNRILSVSNNANNFNLSKSYLSDEGK